VTINLISPEDARARSDIESHFGITMTPLPEDLSRVM